MAGAAAPASEPAFSGPPLSEIQCCQRTTAVSEPRLSANQCCWRLALPLSGNSDVNNHNINFFALMLRDSLRRLGLSVYWPTGIGNLSSCPMAKDAQSVSWDTQGKRLKHKSSSYSWEVNGEAHRLGKNTVAASICPGSCRANFPLPISNTEPLRSSTAAALVSNGCRLLIGRCDSPGLLWQAGPVKSRVFPSGLSKGSQVCPR